MPRRAVHPPPQYVYLEPPARQTVIWVPRGLHLDETSGHIDNLCCFAAPGKVLLSWTDNVENPNYSICREVGTTISTTFDT